MDDIDDEITKFKHRFQCDFEQFSVLKEQYFKWFQKWNNLSKDIEKCILEVSHVIDSFNIQYNDSRKIIKGSTNNLHQDKVKAIHMVLKMLNNVLDINKILCGNIKLLKMPFLVGFNGVRKKDSLQIQNCINENYSSICTVKNNRDKLINDYFKFVNVYLLNIIDGIKAGADYADTKEENDEIEELVNIVYKKLLEKMEQFLEVLDITRIKVDKFQVYNSIFHEVFDIQETDNNALHEKVCQVVKYGYIYNEMIYTKDHKYIVRPAEVIVYKYNIG